MLNLKLGNNDLSVTLNERITIDTPVILLLLQYTQSTTTIKIINVTDVSASGDRVNKLQLELVATQGDEDLDNGKVFLGGGDYNYEIYESINSVLDVTGKNRLEKGIVKYDTDTNVEADYDDVPTEKIYKE